MEKLLIVVDMQNDFINGLLGTSEAMAIVDKVMEKIKSFDGKIVYTKDSHTADYLNSREGKLLPIQHCRKGTDGWRLCPEIEKLFLDMQADCIEKVGFGACDLPEYINKKFPNGIDYVELVGLCTDACVLANAMLVRTFFPETEVVIDASCCAGITPQGHKTALDAMRTCQITIINC